MVLIPGDTTPITVSAVSLLGLVLPFVVLIYAYFRVSKGKINLLKKMTPIQLGILLLLIVWFCVTLISVITPFFRIAVMGSPLVFTW
ncbi:hypothetical protein ACFLQ2_02780 [archaeon]